MTVALTALVLHCIKRDEWMRPGFSHHSDWLGWDPAPAYLDTSLTSPNATQPWFRTWYNVDCIDRVKDEVAYRIENGTQGVYSYSNACDPLGNRTVTNSYAYPFSLVTPTSLTQYNAGNDRLLKNQATSANDVAYDNTGNQTYHHLTGSHSFDSENRLYQSNTVGQVATYAYDGDGRRVKKTTGGQTRIYVYDAFGQVAAEYSTQASPGSGDRYLHHDHLGSTRLALDAPGNCVERWDYNAFGEVIPGTPAYLHHDIPCYGTGAAGNSLLFTGKERDAETGLDYFGARYMASAQGRFTSPDAPFADQHPGDPQSWNLYAYVRNSPIVFSDPTGRCKKGADGKFHDSDDGACVAEGGTSMTVSETPDEVDPSDGFPRDRPTPRPTPLPDTRSRTCIQYAMRQVIAEGEGTRGDANGYGTVVRGAVIRAPRAFAHLVGQRNVHVDPNALDGHPNIVEQVNRALISDAFGRYQIMGATAAGLGHTDFTPAGQDRAANTLMDRRGMITPAFNGAMRQAIRNGGREWASLPGSPYGQPTISTRTALNVFTQSLTACPAQ